MDKPVVSFSAVAWAIQWPAVFLVSKIRQSCFTTTNAMAAIWVAWPQSRKMLGLCYAVLLLAWQNFCISYLRVPPMNHPIFHPKARNVNSKGSVCPGKPTFSATLSPKASIAPAWRRPKIATKLALGNHPCFTPGFSTWLAEKGFPLLPKFLRTLMSTRRTWCDLIGSPAGSPSLAGFIPFHQSLRGLSDRMSEIWGADQLAVTGTGTEVWTLSWFWTWSRSSWQCPAGLQVPWRRYLGNSSPTWFFSDPGLHFE